MQQLTQPRPTMVNFQAAFSRQRRQGLLEALILRLAPSVLGFVILPAILSGKELPAQTAKPAQQQKAAAKADQPRQPAPEAIAAPPVSPTSAWPANRPASQARVSWDSRGLEIQASNSSLDQILQQVAAITGAKLEGFIQDTPDQRIFGSYGPGPGCDVLAKLLDGSGYNVLMIGSRDADAPLKIVLSPRSPAIPQTPASNRNRSNSEHDAARERLEPQPQPDYTSGTPTPQPNQNPFSNGEPPRDPMQFMDEILQRQQKIDQQQQQQQGQQNNPQQ